MCFTRGLPGAPQGSVQAQAHADKGLRLMQEGDLRGAETELRLAVRSDPENAVHLGSLGAVLGMEKKLKESSAYLEKALRLNPADSATRRNLASNQFQLGQLDPARQNLERLLKVKPDDRTSVLLLGMVDEELHDEVNAVRLLASVPDQVRQRPESLAALARAYYQTHRPQQARETLRELERSSAGPEGVFLGGEVAAQANDFEYAERIYASIWSSYPDTARLGYQLAIVQYRAHRIQDAHTTLQKLIAAGHESSDIYNLLGWCLYREKSFKEAVAALDKAIALDPGEESNYLDVGMMLIELRRYEGALAAAQKALEVAPESYQAQRLMGLAETKLGRIKDAEAPYARAVELNPSDEQAILGLASAQLDKGDYQGAEVTLSEGVKRLPQDGALYVAYGSMLLWLAGGNDAAAESRAVPLLRKSIELDGRLAEPHYQLGKLALRGGRIQEASEELQAAVKVEPNSSKNRYALAQVYRKLGRSDDAARELQAYQKLKATEDLPAPVARPEKHSSPR